MIILRLNFERIQRMLFNVSSSTSRSILVPARLLLLFPAKFIWLKITALRLKCFILYSGSYQKTGACAPRILYCIKRIFYINYVKVTCTDDRPWTMVADLQEFCNIFQSFFTQTMNTFHWESNRKNQICSQQTERSTKIWNSVRIQFLILIGTM